MSGKQTETKFSFRGLLGNGSSNYDEFKDVIDNSLDEDTLEKVFAEASFQLETDLRTELHLAHSYIDIAYQPLNLAGVLAARNEASPDIELRVLKFQRFYMQSGFEVFDGLRAGARLGFWAGEGVIDRFQLTEGNFPSTSSLRRLTFAPGVAYSLPKFWDLQFSVVLDRLGRNISGEIEGLTWSPVLETGVAISPPTYWGQLTLALDFRSLDRDESWVKGWRYGMLYQLGSMAASLGFDARGFSAGVQTSVGSLGAGILYGTSRVFWNDSEAYTQSMYSQLTWRF